GIVGAVSTTYLVTGGTGLIGRELVPRLLARGGEVHLLVRAGSPRLRCLERFRELAGRHGAALHLMEGDVTEARLGLSAEALEKLGGVGHVFHLAGAYSLEESGDRFERVNVEGTRNVVEALRTAGFRGVLHHASSVAVAGDYAGT